MFENGDFVVVNNRVGVVCHGRKCIESEIEVWLGELNSGGLPITYYIAAEHCVNIKLARIVHPYLQIFNRGINNV